MQKIIRGKVTTVTFCRDWFSSFKECSGSIYLGDNAACEVKGFGTVPIKSLVDGQWLNFNIENVAYVPTFRKNLFSIGLCTEKGLNVVMTKKSIEITRNGKVVIEGIKQSNQLYKLVIESTNKDNDEAHTAAEGNRPRLWHDRLGHVNKRAIQNSVKLVNGMIIDDVKDFFCAPCQLGKSHRLTFPKIKTRVKREPGEFIHSDVCGPMSINSIGEARFYVSF